MSFFLARQPVKLTGIITLLLVLVAGLPRLGLSQTADQIQIFRNLPAEQQQAILNGLTQGTGASLPSDTIPDRQVEFPDTVRSRNMDLQNAGMGLQELQKPKLKGRDTLLLSLEIREFKDQQMTQGQAMQLAAGAQSQPSTQTQNQTTAASSPVQPPEKIERTLEDLEKLTALREVILRRNPYQLDRRGALYIAEVGTIPLAGLTAEEARKRLAAEWVLRDFVLDVSLLPAESGSDVGLKPFGYDLFAGMPTTFAPATDVPVPAEYVVGPGDTLQIQLFGSTKGTYALVVGRDGNVNFPEIGPITVSGLRFDDARSLLQQRVNSQLIGTQVSVAMGELRSIRIFVLGDAQQPGSYTVSGLSTITNALFVSGGVKNTGSLRNIELKRNGNTVGKLDLYDLLLKGDTRGDARLLPGDVIFIPPLGPTVGLAGEVRRPAIYELRGETSVAQLIQLGGGLDANADPELAALTRIDDARRKTVLDVNIVKAQADNIRLGDGDVLTVHGIRSSVEDSVALSGHVQRPGTFQYRTGMRLSDAIASLDELQTGADQNYVLVRREAATDHKVSIFSADLAAALAKRGSAADIELAPRDRIYVFDLQTGRDRLIEPLLRELRMQSSLDTPLQVVSVAGSVKVPGQYPLEPGMRVSDLVRAGGSLGDSAYGSAAELTRYKVVNGDSRKTELINIDLARVRAGDLEANILLQPFDYLVIKEVSDWGRDEKIEVVGEVRFPGTYPIRRGETLRSVLERAGGVTDLAFSEGSVFTRQALKDREKEQIETLTKRMESDLTALSLQAAQETGRDPAAALSVGQSLLASLRNTKPVGRLVINLDRVGRASPGSSSDVFLKDGDKLFVPRVTQEVTVMGEVQSATSHLYTPGAHRNDYIQLSGGNTQRADKKRTYVVRADGSVIAGGGRWFSSGNTDMHPGDTVVVPMDAERMRALPMWTAITQIVYNLAIAAAAVSSFQ